LVVVLDGTDGCGSDGGGSNYEALDDRMLPCNFTCWRGKVVGVPMPYFQCFPGIVAACSLDGLHGKLWL